MPVIKKPPLWTLALTVGIFVSAVLWWTKPTPRPVSAPEPKALQVATVAYQPQTHSLPAQSQGTLTPLREIDLVAQVGGAVQWVAEHFAAGGAFEADTPLIRIEQADYRIAEIRAQAQVADARQLLATEKGRVRQAEREWRDLGNEEANALFLRKPQLAAAHAQLAASEAALEQARLDLARTQIQAPFTGRIRETYVNLGQYLTPGSRIARLFDSQVAQVRLPLTDSQIALLDLPLGPVEGKGPTVTLNATVAGRSLQWQGTITRTEASLDEKTRLYHAVAEILASENPGKPMIMGLFVNARIEGRRQSDVAALPRSALHKTNQLWYRDAQGLAQQLRAEVLASDGQTVWVRAPLPAGTPVITARQGYLKPGLAIEGIAQ